MSSPNPTQQADRLARAHTSEAIGLLVQVVRSSGAKDSDRIAAAKELLDRGHGRSTQAVVSLPAKGATAQRLAALTSEKLLERIEAMGGLEMLHQRMKQPALPVIEGEIVPAGTLPEPITPGGEENEGPAAAPPEPEPWE